MEPNPSILQSMLWSPNASRIFFTFVPVLITGFGAPLTGKSLITTTESPLANVTPLTSSTTIWSKSTGSSKIQTNEHSGQVYSLSPVSYHKGIDMMGILLNLLT